MATIVLFVPFTFSLTLTYRSDISRTFRAILTAIPIALYLFALGYIPLPSGPSYTLLAATTARIVVVGTIILGLISGIGAVSGAWAAIGQKTAVPTASSIAAAEVSLERVREDLRTRGAEMHTYTASSTDADANSSWFARAFKRDSNLSAMQQEVIGLEALEGQMVSRVQHLKQAREAAAYAQSLRGRLLSRAWAVYCACRVCSSLINIFFPQTSPSNTETTSPSSYGDIVAHALAYLLSLLPAVSHRAGELDVAGLSRQISLALVGVIILSSLRVVLRGVTRLCRTTSRSLSASLMLLVIAQLMGIYLLSTLVQLRNMFPPSSSSGGGSDAQTNVFATLPAYALFGGLFDWAFLLAAGACAGTRWAGGWWAGEDDL
ncbi:hypothetical protein CONPUDRAFT_92600 [Coniophora puteana RWD-64-598 SS2]|uniref:Abscisic acid G-protein coupled receptor-like domain-containing protein n=1 Tax=Coniophora puteana (strain RWD-64-598) TaxID=741705 RepID=A0A5M3MBY8_CONPW|nr:uncharacterized protein CONPUDRAFT_92600 [Coniophora puteana RWD-64-598 SS2]EIW76593.1 hypothetical protein CONPUDRAFT_92600 [Coniophora puteana RWD-64-598 SS2]